MFPYLTTGLKKVWAAITALQNSLSNVQGNSIGFVDYNNIQTSNIQTSPSLNPVSRGLYLFYIDGGSSPSGVSIYVNGVLLPIAGWVIGRFFTLEKNDSKLAAAVDNLTISIAEVCDDVKNLRQEVFNNNKRIYYIEKTQRERKCEGCKNV